MSIFLREKINKFEIYLKLNVYYNDSNVFLVINFDSFIKVYADLLMLHAITTVFNKCNIIIFIFLNHVIRLIKLKFFLIVAKLSFFFDVSITTNGMYNIKMCLCNILICISNIYYKQRIYKKILNQFFIIFIFEIHFLTYEFLFSFEVVTTRFLYF